MAITNKDGYDFVNTILRKERNGSALTVDRYNNLLNICLTEKVSDEYLKFEGNQKNSDFFRYLKKSEVINPDVDGAYDLSDLTYTYWHSVGSVYSYDGSTIFIDPTTSDEWDRRISSSLEETTEDYPIFKIEDGKIYFSPLAIGNPNENLLTNSGFEGGADWINPTAFVAEDWSTDIFSGNSGSQVVGEYGFEGTAQGFVLDDGSGAGGIKYVGSSFPVTPNGRYNIYLEYAITDYSGNTTIDVYINAVTPSNKVATLPVAQSVTDKLSFSTTFGLYTEEIAPAITIYAQNDSVQSSKAVYLDKVCLSEALDITFNYLKEPDTPYFDWYYDSNDRIQYLSEGEVYTLQTGETYIDKDDSTVFTSGSVIGVKSDGADADNQTVEMEIPDDDKRGVFYSMLAKLGISIDKVDATQYSIQMEQKEASK